MFIDFINDWYEDGTWATPDPIFLFNFSAGMTGGAFQISFIFMSVGFVIFLGDPPEED